MARKKTLSFEQWLSDLKQAEAEPGVAADTFTSGEIRDAVALGRYALGTFLYGLTTKGVLRDAMVRRTNRWGMPGTWPGYQIIDKAAFREAIEARRKERGL